ncbi:MAG: VWA-like domain-containing protein, partial [Clostridia bacterium]
NYKAEEVYDVLIKHDKKLKEQQGNQDGKNGEQGDQPQGQQGSAGTPQQGQGQSGEKQKQQGQGGRGQSSGEEGSGQEQAGDGKKASDFLGKNKGRPSSYDKHDNWEEMADKIDNPEQGDVSTEQDEKKKSLTDSINKFFGKKKPKQAESKEKSDSEDETGIQPEKPTEQQKKEAEERRKRVKKSAEKIKSQGIDKLFKEAKADRDAQIDELTRELMEQKELSQGGESGKASATLGDVGRAKAIIPWEKVLRRTIDETQSRKTYQFVEMEDDYSISPTDKNVKRTETEIVLDTSGSISETLLKNFVRETANILRESQIKVGCADTEFYGFKTLRKYSDIEKFIVEGGGNTDFEPMVGAFSRTAKNKIIFTDGYANVPKKECNAIWIVFGKQSEAFGGEKPKGGKVEFIDGEALAKLKQPLNATISNQPELK